MKHSYYSK